MARYSGRSAPPGPRSNPAALPSSKGVTDTAVAIGIVSPSLHAALKFESCCWCGLKPLAKFRSAQNEKLRRLVRLSLSQGVEGNAKAPGITPQKMPSREPCFGQAGPCFGFVLAWAPELGLHTPTLVLLICADPPSLPPSSLSLPPRHLCAKESSELKITCRTFGGRQGPSRFTGESKSNHLTIPQQRPKPFYRGRGEPNGGIPFGEGGAHRGTTIDRLRRHLLPRPHAAL